MWVSLTLACDPLPRLNSCAHLQDAMWWEKTLSCLSEVGAIGCRCPQNQAHSSPLRAFAAVAFNAPLPRPQHHFPRPPACPCCGRSRIDIAYLLQGCGLPTQGHYAHHVVCWRIPPCGREGAAGPACGGRHPHAGSTFLLL